MHPYNADFYGHEMKAVVLGYIRPELDYTSRGGCKRRFQMMTNSSHDFRSLRASNSFPFSVGHLWLMLTQLSPLFFVFSEGLIEDIETDKRVALKSLMRPAYQKFTHDKHFELTPVH